MNPIPRSPIDINQGGQFKSPPIPSPKLPDWLSSPSSDERISITPVDGIRGMSQDRKQLMQKEYDIVYFHVLDLISSGYTLSNAIKEIPVAIESGSFLRWIKKDPQRYELYKEAKEIRTEVWAGKIIEHSLAEDLVEDVARSKLIVDSYKWLMGSDNRRVYGDVKQVEVGGTISITAALAAAQSRIVTGIVDTVEFIED